MLRVDIEELVVVGLGQIRVVLYELGVGSSGQVVPLERVDHLHDLLVLQHLLVLDGVLFRHVVFK